MFGFIFIFEPERKEKYVNKVIFLLLRNNTATVLDVGNCVGHMHGLSHHRVLWVFAQED